MYKTHYSGYWCNRSKIWITDTKPYVPVLTVSTQDNVKLLEQWKSGFKRRINWNKFEYKKNKTEWHNQYLDYLIDPSLHGVYRLFALLFESEAQQTSYKRYYLPTKEIKSFNVMIDGYKNIWWHSKNSNRSRRGLHSWLFARL